MERIVTSFLRYVVGRDHVKSTEIHVNRIAQGQRHDRTLAAFKADQARIAGRQDGGTFASKRATAKG